GDRIDLNDDPVALRNRRHFVSEGLLPVRQRSGMSDVNERFRNVASQFTKRAQAVPQDAWDNPSPCEGWVARDIVRHMVAWMPGYFLGARGIETPEIPSVDDDPLGAWETMRDAIQSALDDPAIRSQEHDTPDGRWTLEQA